MSPTSSPLTPARLVDLEADIAAAARVEGVTDEAQTSALLDRLAGRYRALATLLEPKSPFAERLAMAFAEEMKPEFTANLPEPVRTLTAEGMIQSILVGRRRDALGMAEKLSDPAFRAQAVAAKGVIVTTPPPTGLSPKKLEEMRSNLFGAHQEAPEPAIHIELNALGQQIGHKALARLFASTTGEGKRLAHDLTPLCPQDDAAALNAFADRWLDTRSQRAQWSADVLALTSPFMKETLAEADRRRNAHPPAMATVEAAPVAASLPIVAPTPSPTPRIPQPFQTAQLQGEPGLLSRIGQTVSGWIGL